MPLWKQRAFLSRAKPQIATKLLDRRSERMWPRTDLIDRLEIEHALLLAPMGGETTPEMVIAVAEAGGLGGLGCSYMSNDKLRDQVAQIRSGTTKPFNLNFLYTPSPI
jgi:nitronate monooxygenase